jgi:hypothetical protein
MTANEFLKSKEPNTFIVPEEFLIEFAKLHVIAALFKASEIADITDNGRFPIIDKKSILDSYSLDSIV